MVELLGTIIGMFKEIGACLLPSFFLKTISPGTGNEVNHRTASLPSPKTIMKGWKDQYDIVWSIRKYRVGQKAHFNFPVTSFGQTGINFLANPILHMFSIQNRSIKRKTVLILFKSRYKWSDTSLIRINNQMF